MQNTPERIQVKGLCPNCGNESGVYLGHDLEENRINILNTQLVRHNLFICECCNEVFELDESYYCRERLPLGVIIVVLLLLLPFLFTGFILYLWFLLGV